MFGPLAFKDTIKQENDEYETTCPLCDDKFNLQLCLPTFLAHIFHVHHMVIEEPQNVDNLKEYINYWKDRFHKTPMEQIVPAISVSESKYFLISTLCKEDKELRHKLKLESMLKVQEFERNDQEFIKPCLFCKLNFKGKRCDYLLHLSNDHNIRLGNPQNLVFVDQLLEQIEAKLDGLQCLYCENTFPDRTTMKEHMRKKQHKRINPGNQTYDKYYAVNYLDPDRQWHNTNKDEKRYDSGSCDNSDREYEDWNETEASIVCLFCAFSETDINKLCAHMGGRHGFNFHAVTEHLDFYQKVKLVNYVRRQIHKSHCICCDAGFGDMATLACHMESQDHHRLPDTKVFDHPEFYFPTYENDPFLYFLEEIVD